MNTHAIEKHNETPDAPPAPGQYDENAVRVGALELIVKQQRAEIKRLNQCIKELEREAIKEPRGFEMTEREFLRQRHE